MQIQHCPNCGYLNKSSAKVCIQCEKPLVMVDDSTLPIHEDKTVDQTHIPDDILQRLEAENIDPAATMVTDSVTDDEIIDTPIETSTVITEIDEYIEIGFGALNIGDDVVMTHEESNTIFLIENQQLDEVVIGRKNRKTGYVPTIDLSELDGHKQGVSRRHATITRKKNYLMLTDNQSANGTYLNGQRLIPEQSRILRDGDIIRVGLIVLKLSYQKK